MNNLAIFTRAKQFAVSYYPKWDHCEKLHVSLIYSGHYPRIVVCYNHSPLGCCFDTCGRPTIARFAT